jgi:GDP-4-dehydro-6-deoxy-D-mannose reductase
MKERRVLVTGQRGFIGRRLVCFLQSQLPQPHIIDHQDPIPFGDPPLLRSFLKDIRPGTIFHLASHQGEAPSTAQPLLEALLQEKLGARVVFPGSAAEYGKVPPDRLPVTEDFPGKPLTPYGRAKESQTRRAKEYAQRGLDIVIVRIFNTIGKDAPEHTLIGSFLSKIQAARAPSGDRTVAVGDLDIKRDFVDLEDVCRGLALLAEFGTSGEVYNICSGYSVALRAVLQQMIDASGTSIQVASGSPLIAKNPVADIYGSMEKTRAAVGWSPSYGWEEAVLRLFR